ncbi:hypothetical protein [Garicola koreensis]|uniref:Uncharacterized protein n=1 Tax=Garicola koreensis TaxID=1262554 RepID=A0A7W5TVE3_9MICC|nr:hypothetical protein [Garicola koreensis]MBB3667569.1 hypothetical protein [Garicola koreensis]
MITRYSAEHSPLRATFVQVSGSGCKADTAAPLGVDVIEDIADWTPFGKAPKLDSKVLLQRLMVLFGLALQSSVDFFGHVADQNMGHAYIMIAHVGKSQGSAFLGRLAPRDQ